MLDQSSSITNFAFPNGDGSPSDIFELFDVSDVSGTVFSYLAVPKLGISLGFDGSMLARVTMPKTSVNKQNNAKLAYRNIRSSWKIGTAKPVVESQSTQTRTNFQFGCSVAAFDARHQLTS